MVKSLVKIGDRLVGEGEPCFVIAEAGVNHNGDINLAKKLVDTAREAGADAVKFQTFKTEQLVTRSASKARYQKETTGTEESQFEMIKKLELTGRDFKSLFNYAQSKDIVFLSTPYGETSVDLLARLGVPAFKISSADITNLPLLGYIASRNKAVILSTGMATLGEVEEAIQTLRKGGAKDIVLLHCIFNYPARIEDMNLRTMETLRRAFGLPVGLSDHSLGITIPIAATALGACVIEKHFTLDRSLPGPDHRASLAPDELKQMVSSIRDIEKALGNGVRRPTQEEEENKKVARRSIVAKVDIACGAVITRDMLDIKRPGTGLEPKYLDMVCGTRAKVAIKKDETIHWMKLG